LNSLNFPLCHYYYPDFLFVSNCIPTQDEMQQA
jgi:hypothetical protein